MSSLHPTLRRQLKRLGIDENTPPNLSQWTELLGKIQTQYQGADDDRYMLERSLSISSTEMQKLYENLKNSSASEINKEKNKLVSLLESITDGVIQLDEKGNIVYLNQAASRALVDWQQDIVGHDLLDYFKLHVPFSEQALNPGHLQDWLSWGERLRDDNAMLRLPHDVYIPVSVALGPLVSGDGMSGFVVLFRDMRLQKEVEDELRRAKALAEDAAETKANFLATMSHEIRTPLNGVIGMATLLSDTSLNEEQHHFTNTLKRSAEVLLSLINDILDFSKIEAGKMQLEAANFTLKELQQDLENLFHQQFQKKNVALNFLIDSRLPLRVSGDINRLRQVMINLLGNALKFTPQGSVTCEMRMEEIHEDGTRIRFLVSDTGIGISKEAQVRLFEAFSQADSSTTRKFGGTGLGLSISKRIIQLMQGDLQVISTLGEGSTFHFTISIGKANEQSEVSPVQATIITQQHEGQRRVLLVEDNKVNQMVAGKLLQKFGYAFTLAENGEEALKVLVDQSFDAILMDCQMPIMDGYQATAAIRNLEIKSGYHLPIIGLTANALEGDKEKCLACGMDDYTTKPIQVEALQEKLSYWTGSSVVNPL
jgi:signal transduction histidine kinase/CheY-like chemotaxis protein